jgi:DNA-binding NarL/FixJ family response regulator
MLSMHDCEQFPVRVEAGGASADTSSSPAPTPDVVDAVRRRCATDSSYTRPRWPTLAKDHVERDAAGEIPFEPSWTPRELEVVMLIEELPRRRRSLCRAVICIRTVDRHAEKHPREARDAVTASS